MKRLVLAVSLTIALVGGGCDDDGDAKPMDAKPDGPIDAGGETGAAKCVGTFSALTRAQLGGAISASGKCAMPKDLDFICTGDLATRSRACGLTCLSTVPSPAVPGCVSTCIQGTTGMPDLTAPCAECYRDLFTCTLAKCMAPCTADPASAACISCQQTQGCLPMFFQCTGLPGGTLAPDAGTDAGDAATDKPADTGGDAGVDVPSDAGADAADAADATAG